MLTFTDLFIRTPGDFFYHVIVVLMLSTGLMIAYGQRLKRPQSHTAAVYGMALLGAVAGWFFVVAGAVFSVYSGQEARAILPPLERAVTVGMMLLLLWAFLTADTPQDGNTGTLVLLGLVAVTALGYIFTGVQWVGASADTDFNLSLYGLVWTFAQAVVALGGGVLIAIGFRRVLDAPLKFLFVLILLAGYGGTLWQMATGRIIGDYSGLGRMGLFLAIPIVPYVLYRKVIYGYELVIQAQQHQTPRPVVPASSPETVAASEVTVAAPLSASKAGGNSSPVERESVQLLRTLGLILEGTAPADIPARIVRASVEVLKADVGALLGVKDANYADILTAYDHAMRRPIPAMLSLNLDQQMTLANAIDRKQQRPLLPDRNWEELEDLYSRLDVPQIGPAYFQPLMRDRELIAVLVVALPYGKRELRDAERELLKGIGIISGSLLALSYAADDARTRAEERVIHAMVSGMPLDEITDVDIARGQQEMRDALEGARVQNEALQRELTSLRIRLDDERTRLKRVLGDTQEGMSVTQRIEALNDEHERLRYERDQLAQRLQEAETALTTATGTDEDALFQTQIETLNREKAELTVELEALRDQLTELEGIEGEAAPEKAADVLEGMTRERERLEAGKEELNTRLLSVQDELEALGIDGGTLGLTQLVQQLYEQRAVLQARAEKLQVERDALLNERQRFEKRIRAEDERETQIETMGAEIRHLATDREAITRQRDALRQERKQLQAKLDRIKEQRARLLADVSTYQEDITELQDRVETVRATLQRVTEERNTLATQHESLRAEFQTVQNERDQLLARIEGNRERLEQLSNEAHEDLRSVMREITTERDDLKAELNAMQIVLEEVERRLSVPTPPDQAQGTNGTGANPELLMSMVDSLRTPMTSIVGYIDLLVSESAGLLSEMQRKFIQRISANVVRLDTMLNDLSHITALDTGMHQLTPEPTSVIALVEDAITNATYQFREKDLTVQILLDDSVPDVNADRDSIEQVVGQLLTNAYLVSPAETAVTIRASLEQSDELAQVVVAVTDSGGGIPEDEQSEVFARRYRTEHQLVTGLGDTGVGLSIAKALVEAHEGQMWFEVEPGQGTTFVMALPVGFPVEVGA